MFSTSSFKANIILGVLGAAVLTSNSAIAGISPENPTRLTTPTLTNLWSSARTEDFYYSFISQAGRLQVTLDTTGDAPGCQTVRVDIFDLERRDTRNNMLRYGGLFKLACRERGTPRVENITISERRPLLMKVSVENTSSSGGRVFSGSYTVTLGDTFEPQPTITMPQIDPRLLREKRFFDRYRVPAPTPTPILR